MGKREIITIIVLLILLIGNILLVSLVFNVEDCECKGIEITTTIDCEEEYSSTINLIENELYSLENNDYTIKEQIDYLKIIDKRLDRMKYVLLADEEKNSQARKDIDRLRDISRDLKQIKSRIQ